MNSSSSSTMMFFLFLEFDPIDGPVVSRMKCSHDLQKEEEEKILTKENLETIKFNSFPESVVKLTDSPHIYSFRVGDFFAYVYYKSVPDKSRLRGFHQYSFCIITENRFYPIWYRLLNSIQNLDEYSFDFKLDLLCDFGQKIMKNFEASTEFELPIFTGSTPIKSSPDNQELISLKSNLTNPETQYLSNLFFIGDDISKSLYVENLAKYGQLEDLNRLWENVILEKPLLVFGSTPEIASRAVFAIASLAFSAAFVPNVVPYISVTDPTFSKVINTASIIGVSNPIALSYTSHLDVFYIGFEGNQNGFRNQQTKPKNASIIRTEELRASFVAQNEILVCAIDAAIKELHQMSPFAAMLGKIDLSIIEKNIRISGLQTYSYVSNFAQELVHTKLFKGRLTEFLKTDLAVKHVSEFDSTPLNTRQIRVVCGQIAKVLKKKHSSPTMQKALRSQLRDLFPSVRSNSSILE